MKKHPLNAADRALVKAATTAAKKPSIGLPGEATPVKTVAALRLDDGQVVTSVNLRARPSNLAICAEPVAIAQANLRPGRKIKTIVAVMQRPPDFVPKIVPPCGQCRENICNYAPNAMVILREPGKAAMFKVTASDLLPLRYGEFKVREELI
jgi:cytidine deaminase